MEDFIEPPAVRQPDELEGASAAGHMEQDVLDVSPVPNAARRGGKAVKRALARDNNRPMNKEAERVMGGLLERGFAPEEALATLKYTLDRYDPQYKQARQALGLVGALREGFAKQPKTKSARGVAKVVQDMAFQGVSAHNYSRSGATKMLGMGRKRQAQSSAGRLNEPIKRRKNAFGMDVKKAVAEFAYCYCKYEEKKYVSTLTSDSVWKLYCQHHNRVGDFFPTGTASAHRARALLQHILHHEYICIALGSPTYLDWEMRRLQAQESGEMFVESMPRPISQGKWHELYPKDISKEKWRSCVCHLCSEVESLINTWGHLMSVMHSDPSSMLRKGELGRTINVRCRDKAKCDWSKPITDPAALQLPATWPARFKNIVTKASIADALWLNLPGLFCTPCGCGCCTEEEPLGREEVSVVHVHACASPFRMLTAN